MPRRSWKELDEIESKYREAFGPDAPVPGLPFGWPSEKFLETWDQGQAMLDCIDRGEPWDDEADYCPWKGVAAESEKLMKEGVVF